MAIEMRQQMKLSQQLVMTPQLQQAIKLLQLSRLELQDVVRQELEENPVLDEAPEMEEIREADQLELLEKEPAPADETGNREPQDRDHRQQSITERVLEYHGTFIEPFGPSRGHIILADHLQHV